MAPVRMATSSGSIAGKMRDPQLVAPELAVGLGVDDAVRAQHRRDRGGVDRFVEVDRRGDVAALVRLRHERGRERRSPRPSRRGSRPPGRSGTRPVQPALLEHPLDLVRRAGTAWRAPACCRSGRGGTARARSRGRGSVAPSGPSRRSARCARSRPASTREPEPAVAAEALLRGEVVDVELAPGRRAARRRRTSRRRARAASAVAPSGRRGSSITPVDVSLCGKQYASTAALGVGERVGAGRALDHLGVVEVRRRAGDRRELRRELAEHEVLAALLDEAERRGVPEERWCRRCRAAPRSRRAARTARPGPRGPGAPPTARRRGDGRSPGSRARPSASAATASVRTLDGPEPNRPSDGMQLGGKNEVGGSRRHLASLFLGVGRAPRSFPRYQRGRLRPGPAGADVPCHIARSDSGSENANQMWPSTAIQMKNANQSCTNVAPVRQVDRERLEPLHDRPGRRASRRAAPTMNAAFSFWPALNLPSRIVSSLPSVRNQRLSSLAPTVDAAEVAAQRAAPAGQVRDEEHDRAGASPQ